MIKFLFKMTLVFCIAIAAVVYHNTPSGREMEGKVGKALEFSSFKERGKALISKTVRFISLDGLDENSAKEKVKKAKERVEKTPVMAKPVELKEKMPEDERKKIEQIIDKEQ